MHVRHGGAAVRTDDLIDGSFVYMLGIVAAFIVIVGLAMKCSADEERECVRRGGHVHSLHKGRLCLTADGRVLEL